MPDPQEWELPPEAPTIIFADLEVTTSNTPQFNSSTNNISSFDFSMIPEGNFEMTWDGEPFIERGERPGLDVTDDGFLEKYSDPAYAGNRFYTPYAPTEPSDCGSIEELEMCERNLRKLIALFDLPGVVSTDSDWSYSISVDELRQNLDSVPEMREEILRDLAWDAAEANACSGYLNRMTGEIEHSGDCPIH